MSSPRKMWVKAALAAGLFLLGVRTPAQAAFLQISLPDTVVATGGTVAVPVRIADPADASVLSVDLSLDFDPTVLEATGVVTEGTVTEGWATSNNLLPGQVRLSLASTHPLSAGGILAVVQFRALGAGGQKSDLHLGDLLLNEGTPLAAGRSGSVLVYTPAQARFIGNPQTGTTPLSVQFNDQSTGTVTGWLWDFGDGSTSTTQHPLHTYAAGGFYTVTLTLTTPVGPQSFLRPAYISAASPPPPPPSTPPPNAAFGGSPRNGSPPLAVQFSDQSSGSVTAWSWSFGDGGTSTAQHPAHTYAAPGSYTVSLTVSGPGGSSTNTQPGFIVAALAPLASFTATPETGVAPLTVTFVNTSQNASGGYAWFFPDEILNVATPPPKTFAVPGTYTVRLRAYGSGTQQSETSRTITVRAPLSAAFTVSRDTVVLGTPVVFTDASQGEVTSRSWAFGDGTTESGTTVTHAYVAAGSYMAQLTVTGPAGTASAQRQITVLLPLQAGFTASRDSAGVNESIAFTDTTKGLVTARHWTFDDGTGSTVQNPQHVWAAPGAYTVSLTVTGPAGQSTATRTVRVFNRPPAITPAIRDTSVDEDVTLVLVLTGNESDDRDTGTALTWRAAVLSGGSRLASFNPEGGPGDRFTFQPAPDSAGTVQVRLTLSDSQGASASQTVSLTWRPKPDPPSVSRPTPADNALGVPPGSVALTWDGRDPDAGDRVTYEVQFGRADPPDSLLAAAQTATSVLLSSLQSDRTYFWRVTARDAGGLTTAGPVWRFTTQADRTPPAIIAGPTTLGVTQNRATVTWSTDEPATRIVAWALRADLTGAQRDSSTALGTSHAADLAGLLADTTYYYRVASRDAAGNRSPEKGGQFRTLAAADTTAPRVLSGPLTQGVTHNQALVQWVTNEASSSRIEFGLTTDLAGATALTDAALVLQHSLALGGLRADTTYYYRVSSRDAANNASLPKAGQFRTRAAPDTLGPKILRGPTAAGITPERATVTWTTDEVSTSVVEYGLTTGLGLFRQLEGSVAEHAVVLVGLLADTTYYYQVYSVDPSLNPSLRRSGQLRTLAVPDTVAPRLLTGPAASGISDQAATVRWTTDEVSSSRAEYSLRADLTQAATAEVAEAVLSHALTLTGLTADTTYYYRVRSADINGNLSLARAGQFRTAAKPDTLAPRFVAGPMVQGISDQSAWIEWQTDEDADAQVAFGLSRLDQTVQQPARLRRQSVPLTNLRADTLYQVQVTVTDLSGNLRASPVFRFRTLAAPDTVAPRITGGPGVISRTADQAVVEWLTNEPSDSQVEYGLTVALGSRTEQFDNVTRHTVQLANLRSDTTYYYQVRSTDGTGNGPVRSILATFRTAARPDTTAPRITTGPAASGVTDQSATVRWTTDEVGSTRIDYGLRPDLAAAATIELGEAVASHVVSLTNLLADTTYYYRVRTTDLSGNLSLAKASQFRTAAKPDTLAPRILTGPVALGISDQGASIEWQTDEDADGQVAYGVGRLNQTVAQPVRVRRQSVPLANLLADTLYQVQVTVTDQSGNLRVSPVIRFRTLAAPDTIAPRITSGPGLISRMSDQAVLEWNTDELGDSEVQYGLTPAYGLGIEQLDDVVRHTVQLTNLLPDTTYYYRVGSTDASGNGPTFSRGAVFRTTARPDTSAPRILTGPAASGITDQSATVRWTTDEVSSTRVEYSLRADLAQGSLIEQGEAVLGHAAMLSNLLADTTYYYRVRSADMAGNLSAAKSGQVRTAARPDTLAPRILNGPAAAGVGDQSAWIEWQTDEDADGQVAYGLGRLDLVVQQPTRARRQSVPLTNLLADTLYQVQVTVTDQSGNRRVSPVIRFRTLAAPDTAAPRILTGPVVLSRTADQATLEWTTDELGDSQVEYGLTQAFGQSAQQMDDLLRHTVQLTNLLPETTYHYRVLSTDVSGNGPVRSLRTTFRTLARPDTTAPRITAAPVVLQRTEQTATIGWSTDEPADGYVEYRDSTGTEQLAGSEEYALRHEVQLTNLIPAATYQYRVRSADAAGNGPTRNPVSLSFATRAAPDLRPPVIVSRPTIVARTPSSARVQWVTDEPSDSRVEYGPDEGYGLEAVLGEDVTVHTVEVGQLLADTQYHLRASSTDAQENGPTPSLDVVFRTLAAPDTLAPRILTGPTVTNLTATGATIEWTTDEPSSSTVDFGKSRQYGLGPIERGELVLLHVVSLTNLEPGTTYHFRVASTDASRNTVDTDVRGNKQHSRDHNLHTLRVKDEAPPVFLEGPVVFARDQAAAVEWRTDEPTRFEVIFDTQPGLNGPLQEVIQSNEYRERGSAELTNLQRGTFYYYRLTVWDRDDNSRTAATAGSGGALGKLAKVAQPPGGAGSFVTLPDPDTQWPVILTPPRVTARTASTVTVEWETDERSDSYVDFGRSTALAESQGAPADQTRHRVVLTNLSPGQTYQYEALSTDPSGNGATRSARMVATTDVELDLVPPRFTAAPQVVWRTDASATIAWTTDELSTSLVEYGTTDLTLRREDAELARQHRVTLTNLAGDQVYRYRCSSVDGSGNGPATSTADTFRTDPAPDLAAPKIVGTPAVATVTDQSATLAWQTDEMADSFVEYGTSETELSQLIGSAEDVTAHRLTLTNLVPGGTYYARVGSVDRSNNGPVTSAVLSFITTADRDVTAPAAPVGVAGTAGSQAVRLTWTASAETDLAGYNVYRQAAGAGEYALVASMLDEPAYLDQGLSDETEYRYQVTAVDRAPTPNESSRSAAMAVIPAPGMVPSAPDSPVSTYDGQSTVLEVANARPAAGRPTLTYTFQVSTDRGFSDVVASTALVPQGSGTSTSWSFSRELDPGIEYWWRSRANDGIFDGPWMVPTQLDLAITALAGDFSGDGLVGFDDFFVFADHFGLTSTDTDWDPLYDLSGNLAVDFDDFFLFADNFGKGTASAKSATVAIASGAALPRLRLVQISRQAATLAVEFSDGARVQGCGLVLRHATGATATASPSLGPVGGGAGGRLLAGVLRREDDRLWWGGYRLDGDPPAGVPAVFTVTLGLSEEAVGSEVVLDEVWTVDAEGLVTRLAGGERVSLVPQVYSLAAPFPNPFNPAVQIAYSVPAAGPVRVEVYDVLGQRIKVLVNDLRAAGFHQVAWDGRDDRGLATGSGIYLVRMTAAGFAQVRKVAMVR